MTGSMNVVEKDNLEDTSQAPRGLETTRTDDHK